MVTKHTDEGFIERPGGFLYKSLTHGDRTHLMKFIIKKGGSVPEHRHQHEQTGYLLKGRMVLKIDGKKHDVAEGDSWTIEGSVPHSADAAEDSLVLEVFSPVREDYLQG